MNDPIKTDFDGGQDIVVAVRPGDGQERYLFDLVQEEHGEGKGQNVTVSLTVSP